MCLHVCAYVHTAGACSHVVFYMYMCMYISMYVCVRILMYRQHPVCANLFALLHTMWPPIYTCEDVYTCMCI